MRKVELHIELDAELAARAEAQGVMLAAALEEGVRAALARAQPGESQESSSRGVEEAAQLWADENVEAIESHTKFIKEFGVFGDDLRTW